MDNYGGPMPKPSTQERKRELRRQGCINCGQPYGRTDVWGRIELDHIIPWGQLPEREANNMDNLQPMCGRCNRYKSSHTYEELNLHQIPDWPRDFDWTRLAWITHELAPDDRERLREILRTGGTHADFYGDDDDAIMARRVVRYVPALWVHGELFDVPVWPHDADEVDVPLHQAPQYLPEPLGREK